MLYAHRHGILWCHTSRHARVCMCPREIFGLPLIGRESSIREKNQTGDRLLTCSPGGTCTEPTQAGIQRTPCEPCMRRLSLPWGQLSPVLLLISECVPRHGGPQARMPAAGERFVSHMKVAQIQRDWARNRKTGAPRGVALCSREA